MSEHANQNSLGQSNFITNPGGLNCQGVDRPGHLRKEAGWPNSKQKQERQLISVNSLTPQCLIGRVPDFKTKIGGLANQCLIGRVKDFITKIGGLANQCLDRPGARFHNKNRRVRELVSDRPGGQFHNKNRRVS